MSLVTKLTTCHIFVPCWLHFIPSEQFQLTISQSKLLGEKRFWLPCFFWKLICKCKQFPTFHASNKKHSLCIDWTIDCLSFLANVFASHRCLSYFQSWQLNEVALQSVFMVKTTLVPKRSRVIFSRPVYSIYVTSTKIQSSEALGYGRRTWNWKSI